MTQILTNNLHEYTYPDSLPFADKAIHWYRKLLLHPDVADDMTGFDNGIQLHMACAPPARYNSSIRRIQTTNQLTLCAEQRRKFGGRTHMKLCTQPQLTGTLTKWGILTLLLVFVC